MREIDLLLVVIPFKVWEVHDPAEFIDALFDQALFFSNARVRTLPAMFEASNMAPDEKNTASPFFRPRRFQRGGFFFVQEFGDRPFARAIGSKATI